MTIQPWTAWDFLPEMSENNTLKNTIRMQKFPFKLLPYIYIIIYIWCLTSLGNVSYVLKNHYHIDKLDICESLQHLKAWRFPEPFLCGGSRRLPASLVFDYPSVAELVDRGRVGKSSDLHSLGYRGLYYLVYILGIMITHSRETYQPTSIMRWDRGIFNGSLVSGLIYT